MEHESRTSANKSNDMWKIAAIALGVLLVVSLYFNLRNGGATGFVSAGAAGSKALRVINSNLLQPGLTAQIVNTTDESGVYRLTLNIDNRDIDAFVTKDAKLLFVNALDLNNPPSPVQQGQAGNGSVNISAEGAPTQGTANAPVTIIEFSDFQCPFCERFFNQTLPLLKQDYISTGKAKIEFVNFPLTSIHPDAEKAAEASLCANEQGKFWEMHDKLFSNQQNLDTASLQKYAQQIGLNMAGFSSCLNSSKYQQAIQNNIALGTKYGVQGTPAFFINGKMISGAQPFEAFKSLIDEELPK